MMNLNSDMVALATLIGSITTLLGVILQLVNSFRNSKKIDATHQIAQDTFNQTQRVYISPKAKSE